MTLVIAHRGAWGAGAAQNTLAAFERAIALGADMVEFDVRRTADARLIVHHDADVGGVAVSALARRELAAPLLGEVVALCRGRIGMDVEVKEAGYLPEVLALLPPSGCVLTSFHEQVIREARVLAPSLPTGLLVDRPAQLEAFARSGAHYPVLERALPAGSEPHFVWTVNDPTELEQRLSDPLVVGVITDVPQLALELRRELSARTAPAAPS